MLLARYLPGGHFAPHTDGRAIRGIDSIYVTPVRCSSDGILLLTDFNNRSFYSVIVYLNTIPVGSGGGTRFYDKKVLEELQCNGTVGQNKWTGDEELVIGMTDPVAGRLLVFEQSLVHEGVPPLGDHCKYIIRSDVMYQRTPAICTEPEDLEAYRLFREAEKLAEVGKIENSISLFKKAVKLSAAVAEIMGN